MRRRRGIAGIDPVVFGAITLVVAVLLTYLGFAKGLPFDGRYELRATFTQANSIKPGSPVRIAGVNVGEVTGVAREPETTAADVTMRLDDSALPIHRDATAKIRPRIFLEGNFFVDLKPGTPRAAELPDGGTLPITQTATPVQFDQVLTALQRDSRQDLQELLAGYGTALTAEPTATEDETQDVEVQGRSGAQALNAALRDSAPALRGVATVNTALLGQEPQDLSRLLAGLRETTRNLGLDEVALQELVTNLRRTLGTLATSSSDLRATVAALPGTLRTASSTFASLQRALPGTRALARELIPGVRETPATIAAGRPWVAQTRRLLGPDELRGWVADARPTTASLSRVVDASIPLFGQADLLAQCATDVLLPAGDLKIDEGPLSTGAENYKEFFYALVGLAGESQNTDGNGQYVRFQTGGGTQTFSTGAINGEPLFGNAVAPVLGSRPGYPGVRPPYAPKAACKDQPLPDVNGPAGQAVPLLSGAAATRPTPPTPRTLP
jgi:virulence factor Mce-like protein